MSGADNPKQQVETRAEKKDIRKEARERGLTPDEVRQRREWGAQREAREAQANAEKLDSAYLINHPDIKVGVPVDLKAGKGAYPTLGAFIAAGLNKGGMEPDRVKIVSRSVLNSIVQDCGDESLALTEGALLHLENGSLGLSGVHSNKHGKTLDAWALDRTVERALAAPMRAPVEEPVVLNMIGEVGSVSPGTYKHPKPSDLTEHGVYEVADEKGKIWYTDVPKQVKKQN